MRTRRIYGILAFGAISASLAAGPSKAQSITQIYSGNHVYTYESRYVSVKAGIQFGDNNNVSADQKSYTNVFAVSQVGANNAVNVRQASGQIGPADGRQQRQRESGRL